MIVACFFHIHNRNTFQIIVKVESRKPITSYLPLDVWDKQLRAEIIEHKSTNLSSPAPPSFLTLRYQTSSGKRGPSVRDVIIHGGAPVSAVGYKYFQMVLNKSTNQKKTILLVRSVRSGSCLEAFQTSLPHTPRFYHF